jgi:hypothetical protein
MMLSALLLWLACISPAHAIICYVGGPQNGTQVAAQFKQADILCLKFKFVCVPGSTSCSAAEVGTTKWAYATTTGAACEANTALLKKALPETTVFLSYSCCTSDRCNAPDPKLDPAAKVLPGLLTVTASQPGGVIGSIG